MSRSAKLYCIAFVTLTAAGIVLSLHHIPQSQTYHQFCDGRSFLGIPNFANVVSNLPFVLVGVLGLYSVAAAGKLRIVYGSLFLGIALTGLGSAYYHYSPGDATLVWDRLPMTIVFMSLTAATIAEGISPTAGLSALGPLIALGIGSVLWWAQGGVTGDLRAYVFVQYYPMLAIPLILLLFPSAAIQRGWRPLLLAFVAYGLAKLAESADCAIYSATSIVSGHTLKHLAAAWSTWFLVKRFKIMYQRN